MSGRSLLLIGGTGFFGKSFLDAYRRGLLKTWSVDRIDVVARSASALRRTHPDLVAPGVALHDLDVGVAETLPAADLVIHAATTTDARLYAQDAKGERERILSAIGNYVRIAAREHRQSRIVLASSGAVYGQQSEHVAALREDHVPTATAEMVATKRDYAEAKRASEALLATLGAASVRTAVARCFAFVGYHLPRDQHFAIGNFLADGLAGRPVRVNARKAVVRSYMHADDLVAWLMTIAQAADSTCPIYNVGSDEAVTIADVARVVAERFGVPAEIPPITDAAVDRYVPSIARARGELGLELSYDLASAVDDIAGRLRAGAR
ncbi:NAD-dependent epimerase/dehydratase family protein [Allosphingosinicella deserti]|uniref:NAD(P)-dependent oxidoreductase n=1 Tax=Allosphingosinicella deserti TaxID=2116704 RepID=A0A2P7QUW6_9SPHN|nr:NAD(P)-dependent oxidoreductase [Sphingomonas deserti]PSJ41730.1 NAD(P)-dependent oxidoreductase [Sphingomonas deserti]